MTRNTVAVLLTLVICYFHQVGKAQVPITFTIDTTNTCGLYTIGIYNIVGGTAPYTFSNDNVNFQVPPTFYYLQPSTYTITVKDANNAVGTKVVDLNNVVPYAFSIHVDSVKNATCINVCDGYIKVSSNGGVPGWSFSMSGQGNNITGEFSNICASIYTISVTDGNGCYATTTWNFLSGNNYVSASSTATADDCAPGCNGSITIDTIYNVKSPYIAYLDGNIIAPNITQGSLCSGYHTISIQDSIGCNFSLPDIFVPSSPELILDSTSNLQCGNFCSGYARAKANGVTGTPIFSIVPPGGNQLSPGVFTNLCSGSYKIFVQDSTSCIDSVSFYLSPNYPKINFIRNINPDTCGIACNGSISINNISGGVAPYTIIIGNDSIVGSSFIRDHLCFDNSYIAKVRDVEGCEIGNNGYYYKFSELQIITDSFSTQLCNNYCIGNITCNAVGNYGLVSYHLLPDSIINTNGTFNNLCAGSYTIMATDTAGCKSGQYYSISNVTRPKISVNLTTTENVSCSPGGDGIANYTLSNAKLPLQFAITPSAPHDIVNKKIYDLSQGYYYIEIVDSNNCYARDSTLIAKKQVGFVMALAEDENCVPGHDGKLGFVPYSGTNNIVKIDINDTMTIYRNALLNYSEIHPRGNYIVKIEDTSTKCIDSILLVIGFKNNLAINNLVTTNLKCFNDSSGSIKVNNFDSTYTYKILPVGQFNNSSRTFDNLAAGMYTITASTSENCTGSKLQLIKEPEKLKLNVKSISGTDLFCYGKIALEAEFGSPPYKYNLAPPSGFQRVPDIFSELCIGQYKISAIDSNGCIADSTVAIDQDVPDINNIFENATIFYNSITDDITIDIPHYLDATIEIYDEAGKKVYSESSYFKSKKIEMRSQMVGVYIIRIVADKIRRDFIVKKFLKN